MKKAIMFIKKIIILSLILIIGVGIGATIFFYPKIKTIYVEANDRVNNIKDNTFKSAQTSLVYDSNGDVIAKLKGEKDVYYLDFDKIPDNVKNAFVSVEDKNFLNHKGIDLKGIGRASVNLLRNKEISGGGSTITQQLSRNIFLTHEQTFERKIKEIFISLLLEKRYSKEEILEYYINSIYFANGVYGIEAASKKYFNKPASKLTLSETTFLCAIPNNPSLYDPIRKYDNTIKRRDRILKGMLEDGYITKKDYDNAVAEKITLDIEKSLETNNYVKTYVVDAAIEKLMESKGFKIQSEFKDDIERKRYKQVYDELYSQCQKELYVGGYRIYTSIDMDKQKALQKSLDENLSGFSQKNSEGVYSFQGSATCIDNLTGKVVAIVGGRSQDLAGNTLNRAFQSFRQPGSTFKPLVVFAPSIEKGYLPSSILNDSKSSDGPKNYNDKYDGLITFRQSVEQSKNTTTWNLFKELGPKKGMSYVRKMGFEKIVDADNTLASSLGGLTYGVSTLEMASAYSTFSRDGIFYEPTAIVKITDSTGRIVYSDSVEPKQIYTQKASRIMTNMLQSVMTNGTGAKLQLNNMPSAGKTGSTNGNKDGWFAGYTPYYTTVVWCGYDIPKSVNGLWGSSYPGAIWKQYMNTIHKGLPYKKFKEYRGLKKEEYELNAQLKAEEEKKVLIDEIEKQLEIYLNKEINSLSDIESLEAVNTKIRNSLSKLNDKSKKKHYETILEERGTFIKEKKEFFSSQQQTETDINENNSPDNDNLENNNSENDNSENDNSGNDNPENNTNENNASEQNVSEQNVSEQNVSENIN